MQIMIDIPKSQYKTLNAKTQEDVVDVIDDKLLIDAIKNGVPLPKGHGRLIDADKTALLSDLFCYTRYTGIIEAPYEDATTALDHAPTIIPADTESEI